jgi:putative hemolysin
MLREGLAKAARGFNEAGAIKMFWAGNEKILA